MTDSSLMYDVDLGDFDSKVIEPSFDKPVLLDVWARWCSPCVMIAPVLRDFVTESEGKILVAKINVDTGDNMRIAGQLKIKGFPTVLLFEQGQEIARFSGAQTLGYVRTFANQNISML